MMNKPICDFVNKYIKKKPIRFHMPGHKGKGFFGVEKYDITEINDADVLYFEDGIIKKSQENASHLFGSEKTLYSCEGSSLCVRASVYLIKKYALQNSKKPLVLALRNAHKTFITACAVLSIDVKWQDCDDLLSSKIDLESLEKDIIEYNPTAFYITCPDYLGNIVDIKSISKICKKY